MLLLLFPDYADVVMWPSVVVFCASSFFMNGSVDVSWRKLNAVTHSHSLRAWFSAAKKTLYVTAFSTMQLNPPMSKTASSCRIYAVSKQEPRRCSPSLV
jgi:hypothetical protein